MSDETHLNSVEQIFDLLEREKSALLAGDIETLQIVTAQKQAWIENLSDTPLSISLDQIRKIKQMSDQNAALSEACQAAQKSVIHRLSEIQKIQKTMGIYAVDGTFCDAKDPPPKIEARS